MNSHAALVMGEPGTSCRNMKKEIGVQTPGVESTEGYWEILVDSFPAF